MKNVLLFAIALLMFGVALRPMLVPGRVKAEEYPRGCGLQFEPGVTTLRAAGGGRNAIGKVAYDTCTGNVWGFPTGGNAPYPVDSTNPQPPVTQPIYLGRFAVEQAAK